MILYCDTSALVKLYVAEAGSAGVRQLAETATSVSACRIAWAEAHAALARRVREVPGDAAAADEAREAFAIDWARFLVIEITQAVVERAGDFAETFALRGYDSVQLAAAHTLLLEAGEEVTFACFDERLNRAASVLSMQTPFLARRRAPSRPRARPR